MYEMADEATRRVLTEFHAGAAPTRWTLHAWANVNPAGAFNRIHTHPGATWSGTYYVDTGEPDDPETGTPIHFFDPCQGRANTFLPPAGPVQLSCMRPEPGLMCCSRATCRTWFSHRGARPRISIAFNSAQGSRSRDRRGPGRFSGRLAPTQALGSMHGGTGRLRRH